MGSILGPFLFQSHLETLGSVNYTLIICSLDNLLRFFYSRQAASRDCLLRMAPTKYFGVILFILSETRSHILIRVA